MHSLLHFQTHLIHLHCTNQQFICVLCILKLATKRQLKLNKMKAHIAERERESNQTKNAADDVAINFRKLFPRTGVFIALR